MLELAAAVLLGAGVGFVVGTMWRARSMSSVVASYESVGLVPASESLCMCGHRSPAHVGAVVHVGCAMCACSSFRIAGDWREP